MSFFSSIYASAGEQPAVLGFDMLERMNERIEAARQESLERTARKEAAWAALDLDYDAMTDDERFWADLARGADILRPADAQRAVAVIEKHRRDR